MFRTRIARRLSARLIAPVCAAVIVMPALGSSAARADAQSGQFPAAGEPAIVTIVAPGAEPRRELRYRIAGDQTMTMEMTTLMSMTMDMGGMVMPTATLPRMVMGADLTVTDAAESGDTTFSVVFTKSGIEDAPGVDAMVLAEMQRMEAGMVGLSGTTTVSDRGVVRNVEFDFSKITDPQLQQAMEPMSAQMEQFAVPLPVEAVGVGAKWEVRHTLDLNGISTTQLTKVEVTAIDGDTISLTMSVEQNAANQAIDSPDLPPGATMRLRRLTGKGSGTVVLDLTSLVPNSDVSSSSNALMEVQMGGDSQTMGVETKVQVTVRGAR